MRRTRTRLLFALFTVTLLSLWIAALTWAQGSDTPIIISDGSLTMESVGVPWSSYTGSGGTRRHPHTTKRVTSVELTVNGKSQTIAFAGERCRVTAQYGGTAINLATGGDGRALQVATNFGSFHSGATANHLAHADDHNKIGAITVRKGNQTVFTGTGNGGTRIVIHYQ
jgi:hypothetical protein